MSNRQDDTATAERRKAAQQKIKAYWTPAKRKAESEKAKERWRARRAKLSLR